jgi:hypothetical protein
MNEGWIKVFRSLPAWRWYKDANTKSLYLHLLLNACIRPTPFMDFVLQPGEFVSTVRALAYELNMSDKAVRVAMNHLIATNDMAIKTTNKYTVFTVQNWEKYQGNGNQEGKQNGNPRANIEKELKNNILPSRADACACVEGEKEFDFNFDDLVKNSLSETEKKLFKNYIRNWEIYYGKGKKMTIFIATAQLERLIRLPQSDREEALNRAISQNWQNIHDIRRDANGRFIGNATKEKFDPYER